MRGFKVFNPDFTCRGFQYEVGKTYTLDGDPKCCSQGFHFCEKLIDCFNYYAFNPANKVAEIETLGVIDSSEDGKCCTNKIHIVRELTWHEVLDLVNVGKRNSGSCNNGSYNSGNYNSGNCNTGNYNSGDFNSGNYNSGNCNSGNCNSGDYNSGDCNSGSYNSGDCNSGDFNSGDCNSGDFNSGVFNTQNGKIFMFNAPSNWNYMDWQNSEAKYIMGQMPFDQPEWVDIDRMTDEEKTVYQTTSGS